MVPPCEQLFYAPKHAAIGELCHQINGAATGTQVITQQPIYLQTDTMTTEVCLARGMKLYDILTLEEEAGCKGRRGDVTNLESR